MFACAAREHCDKYGTKREHFAKIASKNRTQGAQNPRAAIQVCDHNSVKHRHARMALLAMQHIVVYGCVKTLPISLCRKRPLLRKSCPRGSSVTPSRLPCQHPRVTEVQLPFCAVRTLSQSTTFRYIHTYIHTLNKHNTHIRTHVHTHILKACM